MARRYNWRPFFTDFRGKRYDGGHSEEQRYQAFKARFLFEQEQEEHRKAEEEERHQQQSGGS